MPTIMSGRYIGLIAAVFAGLYLASFGATAQDDTSKVKKEITEAYQAVKGYGFERKEDLIKWFNARQATLNKKAESLEAKVEVAAAESKEDLSQAADVLKAKQEAAAEKIEALQQATGESWDQARSEAVELFEKLEQNYEEALASSK